MKEFPSNIGVSMIVPKKREERKTNSVTWLNVE